MATINTLLTHQGLTIVSGPGHGGQFHRGTVGRCGGLGRLGESVAAVISKDPNVTFAQPVAR